ncbi:hypothetical protein WJX73_007745 [Symbiochloris irregularis]|uniref:VHS domain-containing protein n=1 Tax=Symbiochloris irregularis TaxID=706552 RepID=A0AAW1NYQ3_9CHLO
MGLQQWRALNALFDPKGCFAAAAGLSGDLWRTLYGLTVLDALALNCSKQVRAALANKKSMKRISNLLTTERSAAVRAVRQMLVNWAFIYSGEELGQAAQNVCQTHARVIYANGHPSPTPHALDMRELVQQGTVMVGFQPGTDFVTMYLSSASPSHSPQPSPSSSFKAASPDHRFAGVPVSATAPTSPSITSPTDGRAAEGDVAARQRTEVRARMRQMQAHASYLRKAERQVAAALQESGGNAEALDELEAEVSEGWMIDAECEKACKDIQSMVTMDLSDATMAQLLEVNDLLLAARSSPSRPMIPEDFAFSNHLPTQPAEAVGLEHGSAAGDGSAFRSGEDLGPPRTVPQALNSYGQSDYEADRSQAAASAMGARLAAAGYPVAASTALQPDGPDAWSTQPGMGTTTQPSIGTQSVASSLSEDPIAGPWTAPGSSVPAGAQAGSPSGRAQQVEELQMEMRAQQQQGGAEVQSMQAQQNARLQQLDAAHSQTLSLTQSLQQQLRDRDAEVQQLSEKLQAAHN